ncbi:hypothetical protein B5M09_008007 [Aphanomyces astaci]|uniref:Uncharacterized protein n=1 Tax=Aphanomyces astaci TaxID=112090 RepID=A0A425CRS1_APHAT|nr:hypothetical protein B5M09_008007 [Aphanomyces astaci]
MSRSALTRVEMQQALASRATATTNPMVHAIYPGTAMMQVPVDPYYVEEARRVKENQLPMDASGALTDDLMAQVREQERRKAEAVGKDYAARPASYKGSLSLKQDRFTTRKRSRSPAKRDVEFVELEKPKEGTLATTSSRPVQMSREAEERRRKLVETYGDAASKSKPAMSSSSFA